VTNNTNVNYVSKKHKQFIENMIYQEFKVGEICFVRDYKFNELCPVEISAIDVTGEDDHWPYRVTFFDENYHWIADSPGQGNTALVSHPASLLVWKNNFDSKLNVFKEAYNSNQEDLIKPTLLKFDHGEMLLLD